MVLFFDTSYRWIRIFITTMDGPKQTNQDLIARTLVVKKGMDNWTQ